MLRAGSGLDCEVAVVGAGPYGLAVAAHLISAKVDARVLGRTMSFWRRHMPKGMRLRSALSASDIDDPHGALSFQAYARERQIALAYPAPLETFVDYGQWFQTHAVPDVDGRKVVRIESTGEHFRLCLDDGNSLAAQRVIMATGLEGHERRPRQFLGFSRDLVSHACEHADLRSFARKRVAVVGRGQSACESAALLNDAGAEVVLVCRGDVHWLGADTADTGKSKDLLWQLREMLATKSGVGPFPLNWAAEYPHLVRQLPLPARAWFSARCLRPAAASWLKPHLRGVTVIGGRAIVAARAAGSRMALDFDHGSADFDHVLLATGYHFDLARLPMFAADLAARIRSADGSPLLSAAFESSVPGLHFVGAGSVTSHGPLMRFVAGSGYAARRLMRAVASRRAMRRSVSVESLPQPMATQRH